VPSTADFPGTALWVGGGGQVRAIAGSLNVSTGAGTVTRARAYVTGVGSYYLYINGQRVGNHIMDPPQSVYSKRILYTTFDVAPYLRTGANDVGALLGNYKWGCVSCWHVLHHVMFVHVCAVVVSRCGVFHAWCVGCFMLGVWGFPVCGCYGIHLHCILPVCLYAFVSVCHCIDMAVCVSVPLYRHGSLISMPLYLYFVVFARRAIIYH